MKSDEMMAELARLGVRRAGWSYRFRGYRYDRLEDAIAYARLVRARAWQKRPEDFDLHGRVVDDDPPPGPSQVLLMASLGVTYHAGRYRFCGYSYDSPADAVAYARLLKLP